MTDTEVSSTSEDAEEEQAGPSGPLDGDAARRVAGAQVAIIATSDAHGERDVTVLAGPRCFVRVLDAHRLAYPDEGVEPMTASRSNIAEAPGVAMLLVEPGDDAGGGGRRALHLNGTARAVPADELSVEYGDLPADPVPGQSTDVWVVVDVGDAYALDGADVPPLGGGSGGGRAVASGRTGGGRGTGRTSGGRSGGAAAAASAPSPSGSSSSTTGGRRRSPLVLVLSILVVALVVALIGTVAVLTNRSSTAGSSGAGGSSAAPPPPAAAPGTAGLPAGPPTLFGRVTQVVNPTRLVVNVGATPVTVDILGLDPAGVPPCATGDATAFARTKMQGQEVTLVPDPTIPPQATPPGVTRAYAVLGTQESLTDSMLRAGWGVAGGPSRYLSGYRTEQSTAEDAGVGLYGPPCRR